jgi:hypothetical protein
MCKHHATKITRVISMARHVYFCNYRRSVKFPDMLSDHHCLTPVDVDRGGIRIDAGRVKKPRGAVARI